jgi:hypothetical protein
MIWGAEETAPFMSLVVGGLAGIAYMVPQFISGPVVVIRRVNYLTGYGSLPSRR